MSLLVEILHSGYSGLSRYFLLQINRPAGSNEITILLFKITPSNWRPKVLFFAHVLVAL